MRTIYNFIYLLIFTTFYLSVPTSVLATFDDSEVLHIEYPDWFEQTPFYDLQETINRAADKNKKGLMVLFTTEGCSYCDVFIRQSLGDPKLAAMVQKNFAAVGMEIFNDTYLTGPKGESMPVKKFAKNEGAEFSPTLLFYSLEGKRILRVVGYQSPERFRIILDYLGGDHHDTVSLREYITTKIGPETNTISMQKNALFMKPPFDLERNADNKKKPLVVLFEANNCKECAEFHKQVLSANNVHTTLKKFDAIQLDANDSKTTIVLPNGKRTSPAGWYTRSNFSRLPALLFFNETGKLVLQTDALVLNQRMMNSLNYVLEKAYDKDWSYQRFARSKGIERNLKKQQAQ